MFEEVLGFREFGGEKAGEFLPLGAEEDHRRETFAASTNSFLEKTSLRMAMQGGHQSEPVNSTSTDLFSALAFSKAFSRSVDQPSGVEAKAEALRAATPTVNEASQVIAFITG